MITKEWRQGIGHALSTLSDASCAVGNLEDASPDEHADEVSQAVARAEAAIAGAQRILRETDIIIRSAGGAS